MSRLRRSRSQVVSSDPAEDGPRELSASPLRGAILRWRAFRVPVFAAASWWSRIVPVLVGLTGLLVMPTLQPYVGTGTDPSWSIALNMATARHLRFGKDVVFTFGPLGFLASPGLSVPRLGVVAMVVRFGLSLLLGWLVSRTLLRVVWWPFAFALTWFLQWAIVGGSSGGAETVLVPVLLLIFGLLDALATRDHPIPWWMLLGCGWTVATTALTKFDTGLLCALFIGGFVVAEGFLLHRSIAAVLRSALVVGAGLLGSLVAWWVVLGQRVGDIWAWTSTSWQVFRGYESAMVSDSPLSVSPHESIIAIVAVVVVSALCVLVAGRWRTTLVVWTLSMFAFAAYAKQSFTRYDDGHLQRLYVSASLTLITAAGMARYRRSDSSDSSNGNEVGHTGDTRCASAARARTARAAHKTLSSRARMLPVLVALAGAIVCGRTAADLVRTPRPDTSSWRSVAKLAVSSKDREAVVTRQRSLLPPQLEMPPEVRAALSGSTVHIEPTETSVAWIFPEVRWRPLPVFQSYSAYTPRLDNLNAAALASSKGPGIVLFRGGLRVDHRMARFESPAAQLAFVCHFRPKVLAGDWQVFERRNDVACSPDSTAVTTIRARLGAAVQLPTFPDDAIVVASFSGLDRSGPERVRDTVLRAPKYWFVLASPGPGEPAHRFVAANAGQPHIVSLPSCLRGAWGTYDTRSFGRFDLRGTEWPNTDASGGKPYTVTLRAFGYTCPT